jgi:hypothetical protein
MKRNWVHIIGYIIILFMLFVFFIAILSELPL